jgi:hypothetical protein
LTDGGWPPRHQALIAKRKNPAPNSTIKRIGVALTTGRLREQKPQYSEPPPVRNDLVESASQTLRSS